MAFKATMGIYWALSSIQPNLKPLNIASSSSSSSKYTGLEKGLGYSCCYAVTIQRGWEKNLLGYGASDSSKWLHATPPDWYSSVSAAEL